MSRATLTRVLQTPLALHFASSSRLVVPRPTLPLVRHKATVTETDIRRMKSRPFEHPEIPFTEAHLINPSGGGLLPVQPVKDILATFDPSTHYASPVSLSPPIIKILSIDAHIASLLEKSAAATKQRKLLSAEKEVQVPWTSADGDAERKVELAKGLLSKGDRVTIVFAPRAKGGDAKNKVTPQRMKEIRDMFATRLVDIGEKVRDDELRGKMTKMFWKPKTEVVKEAEATLMEHVTEKKQETKERKEARRQLTEKRRLEALEAAKNAPKLDFLVEQEERERKEREEMLEALREKEERAKKTYGEQGGRPQRNLPQERRRRY